MIHLISGILAGAVLGFLIGVAAVIDGSVIINQEFSRPYMRGQIDAQTGKIYWHLVKQSDGSVHWEYRKSQTTKE